MYVEFHPNSDVSGSQMVNTECHVEIRIRVRKKNAAYDLRLPWKLPQNGVYFEERFTSHSNTSEHHQVISQIRESYHTNCKWGKLRNKHK